MNCAIREWSIYSALQGIEYVATELSQEIADDLARGSSLGTPHDAHGDCPFQRPIVVTIGIELRVEQELEPGEHGHSRSNIGAPAVRLGQPRVLISVCDEAWDRGNKNALVVCLFINLAYVRPGRSPKGNISEFCLMG